MRHQNAAARSHSLGFTLVELLVGLAITAFLLLIAMPSIRVYMVDVKIRTSAQAYYDDAALARSEALRRNRAVSITLDAANSNRAWVVATDAETVSSKQPEAAAMLKITADNEAVTFDGLGAASTDNTVQFQADTGQCLAAGGSQRCLNVQISRGGQARLCDPTITTDGDNRKC